MTDFNKIPTDPWTLEIVPAHVDRVAVFQGLVREIFVTMIPGSEQQEIIGAIAKLQQAGFRAVPHVTARSFTSEKELACFCQGLKDHAVGKALVIAGGLSAPAGPYADSLSLLQSEPFKQSGVRTVAMAGHPEGNPADKQSFDNLVAKWQHVQQEGLSAEIVSQWSFSPEKVNQYIERVRAAGISCPVRIGIAGPASLKTLLKYAQICGVTAAKEVLKKQGFSFGRLLVSNNPKSFVSKVSGTDLFHLYPFGGLEKCADWLRQNHPALAEVS